MIPNRLIHDKGVRRLPEQQIGLLNSLLWSKKENRQPISLHICLYLLFSHWDHNYIWKLASLISKFSKGQFLSTDIFLSSFNGNSFQKKKEILLPHSNTELQGLTMIS